MKKGSMVGAVLMVLSGLVCFICLLLPSLTNGHASFEECMAVFIPSAILFAVAALLTVVSVLRAKKVAE
jgi:hypothetical protein